MDVDHVLAYLGFVEERHRVWERRQQGAPQPWTSDPIIAGRKFTNVFRVLDPGSQYALRLLDDAATPLDALARAFLYRFTNRPETWEYLRLHLRQWPTASQVMGPEVMELLLQLRGREGAQVFSGAYIIMPNPGEPGVDKVKAVVRKTRVMLTIAADAYLAATTHADRVAALRTVPAVGDFMAQQVVTDMGYSRHGAYDENESVVLGPGSRAGLKHLGLPQRVESVAQIRNWLLAQPDCPRLQLSNGATRPPSLMDVQNTLCEWSKYARLIGKPAPAPYRPAHPGPQPTPFYPEHWSN